MAKDIKNDYRVAQAIDLEELRAYFTEFGFTVAKAEQWWRHAHGKLTRDGTQYFFKLASTPGVGARTRNEAAFYQQVGPLLHSATAFQLPNIAATGVWSEKYYYIAEFIDGPPLATRNPPDMSRLCGWLPHIAEASALLCSVDTSGLSLPRDANGPHHDPRQYYLDKAQRWKEEVDAPILDKVMEVAHELPEHIAVALGHGDFVPWHMLAERNGFVLVDAEHTSVLTPLGYDIAYCCHRLATAVNSVEMALELIGHFRSRLPKDLHRAFDRQFRQIMALRVIGGFWDAQNENTDFEPHTRLAQVVLEDQFI